MEAAQKYVGIHAENILNGNNTPITDLHRDKQRSLQKLQKVIGSIQDNP